MKQKNNQEGPFITSVSLLAAGSAMAASPLRFFEDRKLKVVLVGTGVRGTSFLG